MFCSLFYSSSVTDVELSLGFHGSTWPCTRSFSLVAFRHRTWTLPWPGQRRRGRRVRSYSGEQRPSAGSTLSRFLLHFFIFTNSLKSCSWLIIFLNLSSYCIKQMFHSYVHKSELLIAVSEEELELWMLARRRSISSHNVDTRSS